VVVHHVQDDLDPCIVQPGAKGWGGGVGGGRGEWGVRGVGGEWEG
jgi:hypothetical protein